MAILLERMETVPRGKGLVFLWKSVGEVVPFAWTFLFIAAGLAVGGWLAHLATAGFFGTLCLAMAGGALGSGAGALLGPKIQRWARQQRQNSAERIHWVTRYGWPVWLKAISFAIVAGLGVSTWGLTTAF